MTRTFRFGLIIVLAGAMSAGAFGQTGIHGSSLSGAQIAGAVAGLAAVTGTVLYFTLRKASIVGCAQSSKGTNSLIDEKDNLTYVLVSDHVAPPRLVSGSNCMVRRLREPTGNTRSM